MSVRVQYWGGPGPATTRYLCLAVILVAWEVLARSGAVPAIILPSLSASLLAGIADRTDFLTAFLTTGGEILLGLVIAYGGGGLVGLLLGSIAGLRVTVLPLLASVYAIPFVVIYPIMTAWLGIGTASKVWFGGLYGFFPMALATAAGAQLVDPRIVLAARSMGASRRQIITEVTIPAALPTIVAGLRLGGALVAIGVVVAEMLAASDGIGFLITQNRTMFRTPDVYFGMILVLLLTGLVDGAIGLLERALSRRYHWQRR